MTFREVLTFHAIGWGNGYAEIVRNEKGSPVALWPLDPRMVRVDATISTGSFIAFARAPVIGR